MHSVKILIPILPAYIAHSVYWCMHLFYLKTEAKAWALSCTCIRMSGMEAFWCALLGSAVGNYQGDVPLCVFFTPYLSPPPVILAHPCFFLFLFLFLSCLSGPGRRSVLEGLDEVVTPFLFLGFPRRSEIIWRSIVRWWTYFCLSPLIMI